MYNGGYGRRLDAEELRSDASALVSVLGKLGAAIECVCTGIWRDSGIKMARRATGIRQPCPCTGLPDVQHPTLHFALAIYKGCLRVFACACVCAGLCVRLF